MKCQHAPTPINAQHLLQDFNCGEATLNDWLKQRALKNQVSGASRCYVICSGSKEVIGYYTLSAGAIALGEAPKKLQRNMPDPLPILLLGRLAVDERYHDQGLGSALLRDALLRAANVAMQTGVFAILVHALSQQAKKFYLSRGFIESPIQPMTLMMTIKTIQEILAE